MDAATFYLLGGDGIPATVGESGRVRAERDVFRHESGAVWSWQGATMFLLFRRFLFGEDIAPQLAWLRRQQVNTVRVLGMVGWVGQTFGPYAPRYYQEAADFLVVLEANGLRCEFVVFADAQIVMPDAGKQGDHLARMLDTIGTAPNVFLEVANEPGKNGVVPWEVFHPLDPRPCPMAYGTYDPFPEGSSMLPVLDYLTAHLSRDPEAWSRKAKDILEYRTGGVFTPPINGVHVPVVSDEPMGAAETDFYAGGRRSSHPNDHFWHHAVCRLFGAGSTFHFEAGLQGQIPPAGSKQQACADAVTLAWASVPNEFQTGQYTRGGLPDCPLIWEPALFPDATSRLYASLLENHACGVAVKPARGWTPRAAPGWRIVSTAGPQQSVVMLER